MRTRALVTAAAVALLLAGCTAGADGPHEWGTSYDYGTPGAVVSATAGVVYYPACKNELLTFDGRTWFPFTPSNAAALPASPLSADLFTAVPPAAASDAANLTGGAGPIGAVVAPGPGDDVGTLVIYENDLAYWESNSGTLHTWLTSHEITYNWVC